MLIRTFSVRSVGRESDPGADSAADGCSAASRCVNASGPGGACLTSPGTSVCSFVTLVVDGAERFGHCPFLQQAPPVPQQHVCVPAQWETIPSRRPQFGTTRPTPSSSVHSGRQTERWGEARWLMGQVQPSRRILSHPRPEKKEHFRTNAGGTEALYVANPIGRRSAMTQRFRKGGHAGLRRVLDSSISGRLDSSSLANLCGLATLRRRRSVNTAANCSVP